MNFNVKAENSEFINQNCINIIKGEAIGLIFLTVCEGVLISALFNSSRNVVTTQYFEISLYYIFPLIIVTCGMVYLFLRFLNIYKNVVFGFKFIDELILNILGVVDKKVINYSISETEYYIGYLQGFNKKKYECLGLEYKGEIYLIPFNSEKKESLLQALNR